MNNPDTPGIPSAESKSDKQQFNFRVSEDQYETLRAWGYIDGFGPKNVGNLSKFLVEEALSEPEEDLLERIPAERVSDENLEHQVNIRLDKKPAKFLVRLAAQQTLKAERTIIPTQIIRHIVLGSMEEAVANTPQILQAKKAAKENG